MAVQANRHRRARPRLVAFAAFVAVALLQITYAGHQFEHLAGDFSAACGACAQFERLDDLVPAAAAVESLPEKIADSVDAHVEEPARPLPNRYRSRAPPIV